LPDGGERPIQTKDLKVRDTNLSFFKTTSYHPELSLADVRRLWELTLPLAYSSLALEA
jgi:hypothetical protein